MSHSQRSDSKALLKQVRALEVTARRNVSSQYAGNYITGIRGSGMEFHEARHYQPGDPIRSIDWNMTARTDEPWIRTYLEEREREIFIALDISPSMFTGWQQRSKFEVAMEIAATLGVSTEEVSDKVGWVLFSNEVHEVVQPQRGGAHLHRLLRRLVQQEQAGPADCTVSDPRSAIHAIQQFRGRRFVVFLISDFIDHDVPRDLSYVRLRHDVSLLHLYDPFEYAGPGPVRLLARSAEGPPQHQMTTMGLYPGLQTTQVRLQDAASKNHMLLHSMSCTDPVGPSLCAFFHQKARFVS